MLLKHFFGEGVLFEEEERFVTNVTMLQIWHNASRVKFMMNQKKKTLHHYF